MANVFAIIVCAFIGGGSRYLLGVVLPVTAGFPWATVLVNLLGSGLLAWLSHAERVTARWPSAVSVGLGVGGLGAFTTFSTFSLDLERLLNHQAWGVAGLYVGITLIGGLLLSWLGVWSARRWWAFPVEEES
ncbi:fluoride efflux transporter FluC [Levilactobacillus parabrevis]|uniref:fluoride efflux transporter FluC n=1 Tax=Levilactobacillus parabrevis TaxID=357278 RepID=UPI000360C834|nr:CrcB family protein [Levilactobacillus parabrevis]MCT4487300.1 CrcB family protein [Levilactobacillus parabrevis]MCT4490092.1 CrcB family protein [Levilactobacillus parabrevis]